MRFTLSTILLLLLPCSVFLAGVANGPNLTLHERVLLDVLNDIAYFPGDYRPLSLGPTTPRTLFFLQGTPGFQPKPKEALDEFPGMPDGGADSLAQAINDLQVSYEAGMSINTKRLSTRQIKFIDEPNWENNSLENYMSAYPAQLYVPGFSEDGTVAVVNIWFPELYHPSIVTYIMIKREGRWTIHFRGIATYA